MIRTNDAGNLLFYVAKNDLEGTVVAVEVDMEFTWGGTVEFADSSKWYIDSVCPRPEFPAILRFRRRE